MTIRRGRKFEMKVHGYAAHAETDIHFDCNHSRVTSYPVEG